MRTWIKNGLICDGTGSPPFPGGLIIEDGRIAALLRQSEQPLPAADRIVDARHKLVTPGFIDPHRHCDLAALRDPMFGELELAQGITSTLCGACGLGPTPGDTENRAQLLDFIEPCLGLPPTGLDGAIQSEWATFPDYLKALAEVRPRINIGSLAGTVAARIAVKGFAKTPFTEQEMDRAAGYLDQALDAGAQGISMGIMYTPECFADTAELTRLVRRVNRRRPLLSCHIRGEGDSLLASVREVLAIAQAADVPLNISHFKAFGIENWQKLVPRAIELIEQARAGGQDVSVDFYPYTGGSTTLLTLLPAAFVGETTEQTLAILGQPDGADRLKRAIHQAYADWDNMVLAIGWERIVISSVSRACNDRFVGRDIRTLAAQSGYRDEESFIRDLLLDEQGKVGIIVMSMDQADVDTIARLPYASVISDSLYRGSGQPHPRLYGSFAKVLRDYVQERPILPLETVIHKMTGLTARRYQLKDRGVIRPGARADLNLFDPLAFRDRATYEKPVQICTGMSAVWVNGIEAWSGERLTDARAGGVLRKISGSAAE